MAQIVIATLGRSERPRLSTINTMGNVAYNKAPKKLSILLNLIFSRKYRPMTPITKMFRIYKKLYL